MTHPDSPAQPRRHFLLRLGGTCSAFLATPFLPNFPRNADAANARANPAVHPRQDWYEQAFYLLHLDHHTTDRFAVGAGADPTETDRLLALSKPDAIQIHAKGNPGWTTYPTKLGYTPPKIARDVLTVWRDIARRRGYAWSIYYNLGRDGEIMNRRPEWNRVGPDGKPRDKMLCYHSGVAENYLFPMIDEIMDRYDPDAWWFDGSCFTVYTCYCGKCRERFRRETSLPLPKKPTDPGWDEFKEMHRQIYRECVNALCARIRQRKPQCHVAVNWAYSLHMPETPPPGIHHLTGDTGDDVDYLSMEAHWYDAQPRPFDLMTTGFYSTGDPKVPAQLKPREQLEQEMAIIIANGGRFHAWDNPTAESGLIPERQEHLGKVVAPFLRARQRWCLSTKRMPAVSLLVTSTHHYAATRNSPACFPSGARGSPALRGATEALQRAHLDYELISRDRLLRQEIQTPFLLVEDLVAVQADEIEALWRFVEHGGTVLLTGRSITHPGLADLCGLRFLADSAPSTSWRWRLADKIVQGNQPLYHARLIEGQGMEVLGGKVEIDGDVLPMITRRRVAKGAVMATLVSAFSLPAKTSQPEPDLAPLRSFLLGLLVPEARRPLHTDAPASVEMVLRRSKSELILHLVNRAEGKRQRFPNSHLAWRITDIPAVPTTRVTLLLERRPRMITLQPQAKPLNDWTFQDGKLELKLPAFAIHQMVVIQSP